MPGLRSAIVLLMRLAIRAFNGRVGRQRMKRKKRTQILLICLFIYEFNHINLTNISKFQALVKREIIDSVLSLYSIMTVR